MTQTSLILLLLVPAVICQKCAVSEINRTNTTMNLFYKIDSNCDSFKNSLVKAGTVWTLGHPDDLDRYFVISENNSLFAIQMIREEPYCDQNVWITNIPEYVIASANQEKYKARILKNVPLSSKELVYQFMTLNCELKTMQRQNIVDIITGYPPAIVVLLFVLGYILWNILVSFLNVLINCCTLAKVNRGRRICCCRYIFNGFCSSLVSRHIYLKHQHDIENIAPERFGQEMSGIKLANREYLYMDNEMYNRF